ncbi:uncharacterized protein LOC109833795 isoform X2 [Asparagus officinalis]|uniref:uncharacterized protein LOC109833795 isoform X2 n=1 Tax=Asparagus officinalis TaxID=4686 RepID=UPI00098E513E|nr:uncharacterized protein LOC109833795 isoform X2 [Asparagus officinalis]
MLSFQPVACASPMAGFGKYGELWRKPEAVLVCPWVGNPGLVSGGSSQFAPSPSSRQIEPVAGVRPDCGLSPEWTVEEQNALKQGLIKYASQRGMMKYIKIASMLRCKTVRDVALRCRWIAENGKRRKLGEQYVGKSIYSSKMVDSCSSGNRYMVNPSTAASYSPMMHQVNQNDLFSCEVPAVDDTTQQLMDENNRMLHQISTNLATYKVQENIELFCHTRNNTTTILNNMSNMPWIMSRMPPLPVSVNEELLGTILSCQNQAFFFSDPGIHLERWAQHNSLLP